MLQPAQKAPIEGEANLTIFDGAGSGPSSSAEPWPPLPRERFSPLAQSGCRLHDCFEAGGAGDAILSPLALSLGRLGQQVSVDPVQRSHQHGCPMMLSRLEWQPLAARHSYQVALRSLWFGMGLQVRPQGVAGLSLPEASRLQRTGCPRGSSPGTARPSCPPFSQSPAQSLHPRASILSDRQPQG
jgi:hypothetical protein